MTVETFIKRLEADNERKKNTHKINKPVANGVIATFLKRHPQFGELPTAFVEFLKAADGVTLLVDKHSVADVGGRLRLLGAKKLNTAFKIVFDGDEPDEDSDMPDHWIGLGWDDNHDWSPVLDTKTGEVRIASRMGSSDCDEVLDSFEDFLEWVGQTILDPHDEALAAEEAEKKPKARKSAKPTEISVPHAFDEPKGRLLGLSVSADGRRAVTYGFGAEWHDKDPSAERTLRLWDLPGRRQVRALDVRRSQLTKSTLNADGTGTELRFTTDGGIEGAAISPDGRFVAANVPSEAQEVVGDAWVAIFRLTVFDADSGKVLHAPKVGRTNGSVRFSPDGRYVLAAGGPYAIGDGVVHLLDAKTFELLAKWEAHKPHTVAAVFTPDGNRVITSGWNKVIKIWATPTGKLIEEVPRQRTPIIGLAVSPDSERLALGSFSDRVVRVMGFGGKSVVAELPGHTPGVQALSFSADGARLATIDGRGTVRVWDVASSTEIARFVQPSMEGHIGDPPGTGVAFLPDGKTLVSCGWDHRLRLLTVP